MNGDNILKLFRDPLMATNELLQCAELKPCPFCGSKVITIYPLSDDLLGLFHYACCKGCYAQSAACKTEDDVIIMWNKRQR